MINDFKLKTIQHFISNFKYLDCDLKLTWKQDNYNNSIDYFIILDYLNYSENIYVEYLSINEIKIKIEEHINDISNWVSKGV